MNGVRIRAYRPETDAERTAAIFYQAVRQGASLAYTAEQCAAWAPAVPSPETWAARLAEQIVLVAEAEGAPVGFITLSRNGVLDLAFVSPEATGRGIGAALLSAIEEKARDAGHQVIMTDASHLLRPLLERRGWQVIVQQTVIRRGVQLGNTRMEKRFAPQPA